MTNRKEDSKQNGLKVDINYYYESRKPRARPLRNTGTALTLILVLALLLALATLVPANAINVLHAPDWWSEITLVLKLLLNLATT
jgi:hypothetical protein